jgi:hypothetical protein
MKEVGRLDFLETIPQAFTIDSEGQRVAISSAEISWGTSRTTTEKVGFLFLLQVQFKEFFALIAFQAVFPYVRLLRVLVVFVLNLLFMS